MHTAPLASQSCVLDNSKMRQLGWYVCNKHIGLTIKLFDVLVWYIVIPIAFQCVYWGQVLLLYMAPNCWVVIVINWPGLAEPRDVLKLGYIPVLLLHSTYMAMIYIYSLGCHLDQAALAVLVSLKVVKQPFW